MDDQELRHAGHIEAGPNLVKRLYDGWVAIRLDGVVDLDARKMLAKLRIIVAQDFVIDNNQGRAVRFGKAQQGFLVHGFSTLRAYPTIVFSQQREFNPCLLPSAVSLPQ
jgi:hypothetical protein